jgi:hypothetical protein
MGKNISQNESSTGRHFRKNPISDSVSSWWRVKRIPAVFTRKCWLAPVTTWTRSRTGRPRGKRFSRTTAIYSSPPSFTKDVRRRADQENARYQSPPASHHDHPDFAVGHLGISRASLASIDRSDARALHGQRVFRNGKKYFTRDGQCAKKSPRRTGRARRRQLVCEHDAGTLKTFGRLNKNRR